METTINLSTIPEGKLIPLALETIQLYRKVTATPEGRDLLEKKKAELRERGII